jgi:hypothetical protein
MATRSTHDAKRNGRWIPSKDVWISEKRGISNARDPKTGLLKSEIEPVNGRPAPRGKRG